MATSSESGATFNVINTATKKSVYTAPIGKNMGSWNSIFPDTYSLDFSPVQATGSYVIKINGRTAGKFANLQDLIPAQVFIKDYCTTHSSFIWRSATAPMLIRT